MARGRPPFLPAYDFVFEKDPGVLFRVMLFRGKLRLYRLAGQRWLYERDVPPGVAAVWHAHAWPERSARGYLSLPLISEV